MPPTHTLSTSLATGITLTATGAYASPFTITAAGTIDTTQRSALYSTLPTAILSNAGLIEESYSNASLTGDAVGFFGIDTLTNTGTIISTDGHGVDLFGGIVNNLGTAAEIIGKTFGVAALLDPATIVNAGTISGATNAGVYLRAGGTVTNSGTIETSGFHSYAVDFGGTGSRLIVDPGAVFIGNVTAQAGTLELAAGNLSTGTLAGAGIIFNGFTDFQFDPGASWSLSGTSVALANHQTITGFAPGDHLDITDFAATHASYIAGTGLVLTNAAGSETINITSLSGDSFTITTDGFHGTTIGEVTCFTAGTHIRTPGGEIPIEDLHIGNHVLTSNGAALPIRWIGRKTVSRRFADPFKLLPIRLRANSLASGVPARDLLVSPDHAIFIDDILIQAAALVNGISIIRETNIPESFTYYHLELAGHALIFAEGALAETFVDNVDRMAFDNWSEHQTLFAAVLAVTEMAYPRAKSARQVPQSIRNRLAARASAQLAKLGSDQTHAA